MVKVINCDKCDKELKRFEKWNFRDNVGNMVSEDNTIDSFGDLWNEDVLGTSVVIRPHLCKTCKEGYNKIIEKTNEEIKKYLGEKKELVYLNEKKPEKKSPKKKSFWDRFF